MKAITFNPAQIHLLSLVSHIKSQAGLQQLKDQLSAFYARQIDEEMEQLWESGEWNQETLESLKREHNRTPYK